MTESNLTSETREAEQETVVLRPPPFLAWFSAMLLLFGGLIFAVQFLPSSGRAATMGDHIALSALSGIFLASGLYALLTFLRHRVIVGENGLRWRGFLHGWQSVQWGEITDYYETFVFDLVESNSNQKPVILAGSRSFALVHFPVNAVARLKELIQTRASSARLNAWERLGIRRIDPFPRTFRYWEPERWHIRAFSIVWNTLFCAFVVEGAVFAVRSTAALVGWQQTPPLATGIAIFAVATLYIPFRVMKDYWEAYRRRGESLTVTPETLRYENARTDECLEVAWSDVADYLYQERSGGLRLRGGSIVLHGADEKQITWTPLLRESELLLAIVQKYAPKPGDVRNGADSWRGKSSHESVGGSDPATWQSGAVGVGSRVFRNQAKTHRALLLAYTGMILLYPALYAFGFWANPDHRRDENGWVVSALIAVPTLWGWFCYFRIRVETDDMGIICTTPFTKKHLYWYTVADYAEVDGMGGNSIILTGRDGKRMSLRSTLNGYKELKAEIERYAPPPRTGWKTPE
jgi:hypothetical protein